MNLRLTEIVPNNFWHTRRALRLSLLIATLSLVGCVSFLDSTSEDPLNINANKRTFGGYWDDHQLHTVISVNLRKASKDLKKANVNVHVYNGIVLLTGQVPTKELYDLAGRTANEVNNVRQVYNELQVRPNTSALSKMNSTFLRGKIKKRLASNKEIDSNIVEVIVEDDIVYLMGLLNSQQAEIVTEIASTTKGIKKVVRAIEYIDK